MEIYGIITTVLTLVLGGGWFINWRASRREKDGQATQSEAEGWKAMQDLYQQTIADFKVYSEDMRQERSLLKKENSEIYDKYKKLEDVIMMLKKKVSRNERKLDAISPFLCSVFGCTNRKHLPIAAIPVGDDNETDNDGDNDNDI